VSSEIHGARILIVDDDPGILHTLSRILGRRHHVTCVASGAAALDEARRLRVDLAIVDIRMPEMNGFEVTRALKVALTDIDVILMTGNAEEPDDNLVQAIDEGAFYFIQKPFDRRVLLALVTRCLELRKLREEREGFLERVERELAEARRFQLSLLPPVHYSRAGLAIDARYVACTELAGDLRLCRVRGRRGRRLGRRCCRTRNVRGDDDGCCQGGVSRSPRRRFRTAGRG
jgi:CheY-like chemotaxis protein